MRSRRQRKSKEAPELDITAFLNLMVVLVPFLLVSAVFSRVTILELNMPSGAGGGAADDPSVTVEVVVRKDALEISDGEKVIARFPNMDQGATGQAGEAATAETAEAVTESEVPLDEDGQPIIPSTEEIYDLAKLQQTLLQIKASYPDKTDAMLLMEADVAYEHLVGVMDAVRSAEIRTAPEGADAEEADSQDEPEMEIKELFPDISLGDAP